MTCPVCGGETTVMDSRTTEDETKRKRKCKDDTCRYIFRTIELDEDQYKYILAQSESVKAIDKAKVDDILQRCDLIRHSLSEARKKIAELT